MTQTPMSTGIGSNCLSRQTLMLGSAGRLAALLPVLVALVLLVPGCAAQHPLAAAGDRRQGADGPSFALLAGGVLCGMHRQRIANSHTCHWTNRSAVRVATLAHHAEFGDSVKIDFAGPTM